MNQPEFIFRGGDGHYAQADDLSAWPVERTRVKRVVGGLFTEMEGTGKFDPSVVTVGNRTHGEPVARDEFGRPMRTGVRKRVPRTASGIKQAVRRLRPEESDALDVLDAEILNLEERLSRARQARRDLLREAWSKAHVVRLAEVESALVR